MSMIAQVESSLLLPEVVCCNSEKDCPSGELPVHVIENERCAKPSTAAEVASPVTVSKRLLEADNGAQTLKSHDRKKRHWAS